jgi:hypothetical protein
MTDTPPVPPTPDTPPPAAATPPAAPAAAGPKQTLSIVGFILGIASIVFAFPVPLLGLAGGIAGLIVSRKGKRDEPGAPSWMHTLGFVLSIIGLVLSVIGGIIWILSFVLPFLLIGSAGSYYN